MHGLLFKVLDRGSEPSCFQETLSNSTKYCLELLSIKKKRIHVRRRQYQTCSQNRQSIKFQNHENINSVEKLYFFILYNQVYIPKHYLKSLHSGFIFREN